MIKNTINTEQNVQIDYPIATVAHRLAATAIDYCIYIAYYFFLLFAISKIKIPVSLSMASIFSLPIIFYYVFMEIFYNGQSIGKKVMQLQVVTLNGERPSVGAYVIRWLFLLIDYTMIGLFVMLLSRKSQRLGDIVAGTTVISLQNKIKFDDTIYTEIESNYSPMFIQVKNLNDKDIQAIKDIIHSSAFEHNHTLMYAIEEKIKKNLNIESALSGKTFLDTIIKDYNYYKQH